jgi:hypothetical protein
MSSRMPPRYLPTLTEVVDPLSLVAGSTPTPSAQPVPCDATTAQLPATEAALPRALPASATPDKQALAQQLVNLVRPQLEAELRATAQELFEAQFSALLPSLHLHIEEAVREALEQALPESRDARY